MSPRSAGSRAGNSTSLEVLILLAGLSCAEPQGRESRLGGWRVTQCAQTPRWGYASVEELQEVVTNYTAADLPLEVRP